MLAPSWLPLAISSSPFIFWTRQITNNSTVNFLKSTLRKLSRIQHRKHISPVAASAYLIRIVSTVGVCPDCIKCNVTQFFGKKTFGINLNPLRSILNCIWPNLFRTFGWPSIPELYHLHPPKIKGWECTLIFLLGFRGLSRAVDRYLPLQTQCALSQVTHSQIQSSHVQYTTWDRCVPIQFQDCRFRVVKL